MDFWGGNGGFFIFFGKSADFFLHGRDEGDKLRITNVELRILEGEALGS